MAVLKQKVDGIWMPVSEQNRIVDAVYYVGDDVVLTLKRNSDGLTDTAYLSGSGATRDYAKNSPKPWDEYIQRITAIHVGAGVTSIGAYLFAEHIATKTLVFEDSSTITHLGDRCFWRCQFGGEYTFPGLLGSIEVTVDDAGKINSSIRPGVMMRAFNSCVNLKGITLPDTITAIGDNAFGSCVNLERVTGLRNVESVGTHAFLYTPKLRSIDLNPAVCKTIGAAAFCISPAMSHLDMALWAQTSFGYNSCASANWTEAQLAEIREVKLPTVKLWNGGTESTYKYNKAAGEEYLYGTWTEGGNTYTQYLELGCHSAAVSLVWNILNGKHYTSVGQWWLKEIYGVNREIGLSHYNDIYDAVVATAGLTRKSKVAANSEEVGGTTAIFNVVAVKDAIVNALSRGKPLVCKFWTTQSYGHAVAIIGANAATDKLIVADSTKTSGGRGIVYEVALEDLIGIKTAACVEVYEVAA